MKTLTLQPDRLFFTADTHFGHEHPELLAHRRYVSADEMDAHMVTVWNNTVPVDGTVVHLGDVSFRSRARTHEILAQLHGRILLIPGNHDKGARYGERVEVLAQLVEAKIVEESASRLMLDPAFTPPDPVRLVLCHFPLHSWNRMHYGSWHLHGHSHGSMPGFGRRQDVGWDCFHAPVSFQQLKSLVGDRSVKSFDHHQPKG